MEKRGEPMRTRSTGGFRLTTLALACLAAAGLGGPAGVGAAPAQSGGDELVIGALLDLRTGWTTLGRASRVTLHLAMEDANRQLRRTGSETRVRLRIVDVQGEPEVARRELRRLAAEGVRIFVGPQSSSAVKAVRAPANASGAVSISQGSTAHSLAIAGDNVFRLVPDDLREGEAMVALLKRDDIDALAPIWRADAGNVGLVRSVRRQFRGAISSGVSYHPDQKDFSGKVRALARQVETLRSGGREVAVYLAAFDEVVELFRAAASNPTLSSVPWYGSDGVALSTRLVRSADAAAFAVNRGYPNPTLGLDAAATRGSAALRARVRARLGREPDAFALTAYDALQIAVDANEAAGGVDNVVRFKRAFARTANGYRGVTGRIVLNAAGDRAYGSFDFWSICAKIRGFEWRATQSYRASAVGRGRIVERERCPQS
jgi:branched-chain amino acid transport system substrate-binding protein